MRLRFTLSIFLLFVTAITTLIFATGCEYQFHNKAKIESTETLFRSSKINSIEGLLFRYDPSSASSFDFEVKDGVVDDVLFNLAPKDLLGYHALAKDFPPTYFTNSIGGLPAIFFNGFSDYLVFPSRLLLTGHDYTIAIVARRIRNMAEIHILRFNHITGSNYYLNGKIKNLANNASPIATWGLIDVKNGLIGKSTEGGYYNGYIGEIMIFQRYIKDEERRYVEQYLSKKWGIDLSISPD